jgi:hypothetical protein
LPLPAKENMQSLMQAENTLRGLALSDKFKYNEKQKQNKKYLHGLLPTMPQPSYYLGY